MNKHCLFVKGIILLNYDFTSNLISNTFVSEMRRENGTPCEEKMRKMERVRGWESMTSEKNNNHRTGYLIFSALQVNCHGHVGKAVINIFQRSLFFQKAFSRIPESHCTMGFHITFQEMEHFFFKLIL